VYFHRNSVPHGGFDALAVGSVVAFNEEEAGDKGPQASFVRLIEQPSRVSETTGGSHDTHR
jgi:cold shock CspA family protein